MLVEAAPGETMDRGGRQRFDGVEKLVASSKVLRPSRERLARTRRVGFPEVVVVISVAKLKTRTAKDLAAMAKRKGIPGWHGMRKEALIRALVRLAGKESAPAKKAISSNGSGHASAKKAAKRSDSGHSNGHGPHRIVRNARTERRLRQMKAKMHRSKDLATEGLDSTADAQRVDRLLVMVRDSYWLHAYWELTRQSIDRARAAMGPHWHGARPVLRLLEVIRDGTTNSVRKFIRDIEIHGGVNNWYINVADPPKAYQMEIGYTSLDGKFNSLAKSNVVSTPEPGSITSFDAKWDKKSSEDYDRIFALSGGYEDENDQSELKTLLEQRLRRPLGAPLVTRYGLGCARIGAQGRREFCFEVDAELVVYGVTDPDAHVTLRGEPVRLQPDGSFAMRFTLPERRQVLPVVASSGDGSEQRTIVLAVERNTKVMEPVIRDPES